MAMEVILRSTFTSESGACVDKRRGFGEARNQFRRTQEPGARASLPRHRFTRVLSPEATASRASDRAEYAEPAAATRRRGASSVETRRATAARARERGVVAGSSTRAQRASRATGLDATNQAAKPASRPRAASTATRRQSDVPREYREESELPPPRYSSQRFPLWRRRTPSGEHTRAPRRASSGNLSARWREV